MQILNHNDKIVSIGGVIMGLRFRKSFSIFPGIKLNIGKGTFGISVGAGGLRASANSSGRKTTSASIPGTGISFVNSKSNKKAKAPEN